MRDSRVQRIKCHSLEFSSILQVGDSEQINPYADVLAIQQEGAVFSNELTFEEQGFFQKQLPEQLITVPIEIKRKNYSSIDVGGIEMIGATASSIVHIGSVQTGNSKAHVKHVRRLRNKD
ncbi:spore germination protein GerPE [Halalkalibacillus sediminis]|nr:spore germination protein GerPE [Halalkalibacillus sediminis]